MTRFVPAHPLFIPPVVITKVTAEALAKIEKLAPGITAEKGLRVIETHSDAYPIVMEINNIDFDRYEIVASSVMPVGGPNLENCTAWRFTQRVEPLYEPRIPEADKAVADEAVADETFVAGGKIAGFFKRFAA